MIEQRHVHETLDKYGYCIKCNQRVLTNFRGWPLPDRPKENSGKR